MTWQLFCMPERFGERHALEAWGTCDDKTLEYSIGPATTSQLPTASLKQKKSLQVGLTNSMVGDGWGFGQPLMAKLRPIAQGPQKA
mmetsp:Transcript_20948/g.42565  ORF Transcript_20948/g.42565 Transcript_20948/m.42565 type:complete len:86 (+) Transcript_20948:272-529(+)|eukprot:CAMPEP_0181317884 /NCGR_PEP_ID=MMETSP1101-20121128/16707_1 /TAXON_ID=46948 /ORGANISM="Rhodomonas abbreviata, Strain Caron Lab Isolate" /LENGTH=85 /DNA_ID=CAMNT_0023425309 /DNA_START=272 /DNA_END=529 /DNA_ORIENTATION=-